MRKESKMPGQVTAKSAREAFDEGFERIKSEYYAKEGDRVPTALKELMDVCDVDLRSLCSLWQGSCFDHILRAELLSRLIIAVDLLLYTLRKDLIPSQDHPIRWGSQEANALLAYLELRTSQLRQEINQTVGFDYLELPKEKP